MLRRASAAWRIVVRDMAASDVPAVAAIFRDAFNDVYKRRGFGPVVTDDAVGAVSRDTYRDLDPGGCVVVTVDGEVAGSGFPIPAADRGRRPDHHRARVPGPGRRPGAGWRRSSRAATPAGIASLRLIRTRSTRSRTRCTR